MSERVNGSHPLLLHISLSLSQFLCPFHLSPLFMWQQWQTKMEGRKLCSVGHLEETVWNWNEDDPPTAQSLLTLHMDMFYPGFLLLLAEFHTHTHADTQLPGLIFFFCSNEYCSVIDMWWASQPSQNLHLEIWALKRTACCVNTGESAGVLPYSPLIHEVASSFCLSHSSQDCTGQPRLCVCVCVCVCQCYKSTNCKFKWQLSMFSHLIFILGPEQKQEWQLPFSQGVCN